MRRIILFSILVSFFIGNTIHINAWGKSIKEKIKPVKEQQDTPKYSNTAANNVVINNNNKMSKEEFKEAVFTKLKTASDTALNVLNTGETIYLNIPLSNPVLISFPDVIEDVMYQDSSHGTVGMGGGLKVVNLNEIATEGSVRVLKVRSFSPTLHDEEVIVKLVNGSWIRISFSTKLDEEKYNEINILEPLEVVEEKKLQKIKDKYFKKNINVNEISKKEVIKAVKLIVDRLETQTKAHDEQLSLEEKVNSVILDDKKRKVMLVLKTVVAEPFSIVGGIYKGNTDTKTETEIILLNLVIENYGDKDFTISTAFLKEAFENYIGFWFDYTRPTVAPGSNKKILMVIEDQHLK